ncbi:MAG: GNAT family N-acetyltransferase [SAR202 cluster bacterium]|jgi:RimJ/RimL family protein N-acetyltransferase|nr:GNAT family N-acetyltransferase [SAR202 cluster bacterium]MDP6512614.1 GNAT family N-acetyltransferase [SAR202 cluster bacterium]
MDTPDYAFDQIESERLILRRFRDSDLEPFLAYRADPDVARYQDWEDFSRPDAERFIEGVDSMNPNTPGEWFQCAIEIKSTGEMIGDLGMLTMADDPRQVTLGYTLSRDHQGNGYATEAVLRWLRYVFDDLEKHRLIAVTDCLNTPSFALMERVGMRREAHYLQNIWFKGAWGDEYQYAILRSEWGARAGR